MDDENASKARPTTRKRQADFDRAEQKAPEGARTDCVGKKATGHLQSQRGGQKIKGSVKVKGIKTLEGRGQGRRGEGTPNYRRRKQRGKEFAMEIGIISKSLPTEGAGPERERPPRKWRDRPESTDNKGDLKKTEKVERRRV